VGDGRDPLPFLLSEIDGGLAGDPGLVDPHRASYWYGDGEHQPARIVRLHHKVGWTAISFWDRTGDERFGSSSTIIMEGTHSLATMLDLFREKLPGVWARVTAGGEFVGHYGNQDPEPPRLRVEVSPVEAPRVRIVVEVEEPRVATIQPEHVEEEDAPAPRRAVA
jgi:hypothetical protein